MHSLKANWINEMEKVWKRKRTKGFLLLTVLIPVISALVLSLLQNNTGIAGLGMDLPNLMLSLFTTLFLPIFLFMTVSDLFSGEAAARTIKLVLVRPITRSKVFASKVLALAGYIMVHLGVVWVVSVLTGGFINRGFQFSSLFESSVAYAAACLPMMAIGLIAVLITQGFNNSTGALGLVIFIYVLAKILSFIFPSFAVWSIFSYTNWYELWVGSGVSLIKLINTFAILLAYSMMAYIGSLMIFERKGF